MIDFLFGMVMFSVIVAISSAVLLLWQHRRSSVHRWLALFLIAAAVWALLVNIQSPLASTGYNLVIIRGAFVAVIIALYALLMFVVSVTERRVASSFKLGVAAVCVVLVVLSVSPFMVTGVSMANGTVSPQRSSIYLVVVAGIITLAAMAIILLDSSRRQTKNVAQAHRLLIIEVGLIGGVGLAILTNVVLPNIMGSIYPARYAWVSFVVWTVVLVYAAVRYRFLDLRMTAMRTVGYILAVITLVGVYFALAFALSVLFLNQLNLDSRLVSPANIVLALILALLFQPIKSFFDRTSDRIFYHSRYDADVLIGDLSGALISSTVLRTILERAATVLQDGLRAAHVTFVVQREERKDLVVFAGSDIKLRAEDLVQVNSCLEMGEGEIIEVAHVLAAHDLEPTRQKACKLLMRKHCALVLPLANRLGYVLIGERLGGSYSERDKRVLSAISNELVIAIQNARSLEEVQRLNRTLKQRVDAATTELRSSNAKLRKLDEVKDEFVSMASHQLRTPLTSVKGYISMLLEGDAGKITSQQETLLREAFTSSERMVRLIGDFLNISRLQTGKFVVDTKPVDLAQIVKDEIESIEPMAEAYGQTIQYTPPQALPEVVIDEDKTRQVIMNFIDNAIYYSPEASDITIKLYATRGSVVFEVHDRGIGVPRADQERLFTKFFRSENARRQRPDGTGVGLFLAKKIIEAQHGEIIFNSRPGMGSMFGFRLPIKR